MIQREAAMDSKPCGCGGVEPGEVCPVCGKGEFPRYWCEACQRAVADKRCPLCGLKARKIRPGQ